MRAPRSRGAQGSGRKAEAEETERAAHEETQATINSLIRKVIVDAGRGADRK